MGTLSQESWKERGKREVSSQTLVRVWLSLNVVRSHGTVLHRAIVWSDLTFWRLVWGATWGVEKTAPQVLSRVGEWGKARTRVI